MRHNTLNVGYNQILDLNTFIHHENKMFDYHMKHIKMVKKYSIILNHKLHACLNLRKLSYISLAHDIFKERSLDPKLDGSVTWNGHNIPQDLNKYVRQNLDILEKYGLDDYFNSSIQFHPLAAGIFLHKELGITDKEILYPLMFHSCPIISVYSELSPRIKLMTDIIMLSDKLSSNYLRINLREVPVRIDLDQAVFGSSGVEFNYSLGLYIARLISQGKSDEYQSIKATEYYYNKLHQINPIISKNYSIKRLGGSRIWPKRTSRVLMVR